MSPLRNLSGLILVVLPLACATMGVTIPASEASAIATMVPPTPSTLLTSVVPVDTSALTNPVISTSIDPTTAAASTGPFDPNNGAIETVALSEDALCAQAAFVAQTNWRAKCNNWYAKLASPECWSRCPSEARCCGEGKPIGTCRTFLQV